MAKGIMTLYDANGSVVKKGKYYSAKDRKLMMELFTKTVRSGDYFQIYAMSDIYIAPARKTEPIPFVRPKAIYDNKKSLYGIDYDK